MIKMPTIPQPVEPKLIDVALLEIQAALTDNVSWLNHAFGKAQRLTEVKEKRQVRFPAVYIGKEDYLKVFPDSHIGNFSFFDVEDGQEVAHMGGRRVQDYKTKMGLIVWFDFRTVYESDWERRTVENAKSEVIDAIKAMTLVHSQIRMTKTWERAEKIYRDYTDKEIDNQFLMRPFGGFRIDMDIKYFDRQKC